MLRCTDGQDDGIEEASMGVFPKHGPQTKDSNAKQPDEAIEEELNEIRTA